MFENIGHFFKRIVKEPQKELGSKDAAKERLHLVLMQDRANVSADFLELMKQEIIDVIKKYIVVDEESIDVRLTNQAKDDGTNGAPSLYANIPIVNIKNEMMAEKIKDFEGVDFNKEMGIPAVEQKPDYIVKPEPVEEELKVQEPTVIELPENGYTSSVEEKQEEVKEQEEEEVKELFEEVDEDDEDDDDVTFDDLLKAAEEAEKLAEETLEASEKVEKISKKTTKAKTTAKSSSKTKRKKKK